MPLARDADHLPVAIRKMSATAALQGIDGMNGLEAARCGRGQLFPAVSQPESSTSWRPQTLLEPVPPELRERRMRGSSINGIETRLFWSDRSAPKAYPGPPLAEFAILLDLFRSTILHNVFRVKMRPSSRCAFAHQAARWRKRPLPNPCGLYRVPMELR